MHWFNFFSSTAMLWNATSYISSPKGKVDDFPQEIIHHCSGTNCEVIVLTITNCGSNCEHLARLEIQIPDLPVLIPKVLSIRPPCPLYLDKNIWRILHFMIMIPRLCMSSTPPHCTHRVILSKSCWTKLNFDCNYTLSIDLTRNIIPFEAKSIGKE